MGWMFTDFDRPEAICVGGTDRGITAFCPRTWSPKGQWKGPLKYEVGGIIPSSVRLLSIILGGIHVRIINDSYIPTDTSKSNICVEFQ